MPLISPQLGLKMYRATVYEQLELGLGKNLSIFGFLVNKPSSTPILDSIFKQIKFKHNNVSVNKLVNIKHDLTVYNVTLLYAYLSKNIRIQT